MTDESAFEWNPFYEDLDVSDVSDSSALSNHSLYDPLDYPRENSVSGASSVSSPLSESPLSESPLSQGFLYECATCMTAHSPTLPCNGSNYSYQSSQAAYSLSEPVYVTEKTSESTVITANYRKWLLSVSP